MALILTLVAAIGLAQAEPSQGQPAQGQPTVEQLVGRLRTIDDRQQNSGDFTALVYIDQKEAGKTDLVYQAMVYRRDETDKLAILFTKPQSEAGKGYLRVDNNLFFYDPAVGKWERRTERERIGGTGGNRQDFDQSRLAEEYDPSWVGLETLGKFQVEHLQLTAKPGVDVAYASVQLWLDQATGNVLKRQDFAVSGRLVRTLYYPQWSRVYSESKRADVYFPKEIRIFDEIQTANQTTIVMQEIDLKALDDAIFTKAYLESKSR